MLRTRMTTRAGFGGGGEGGGGVVGLVVDICFLLKKNFFSLTFLAHLSENSG